MRRSRFVLATLLAAMLGCGDAAAPGWITAVVALADVGGAPPPVRPQPASTIDLIADTIVLQANGTGVRRLTLRRLEDSVVVAAEISVTWESEGGALRLYHWCPPNGIVACPTDPDLAGPMGADVWSVTDGTYFERPARYRVLERVRGLP
ncbi:MAG: hypothetical protein IT357_18980 [Gemmatimonadaceae bacterium]|nr:hypothetical protein [Gemmatimonadaceae bacterium]